MAGTADAYRAPSGEPFARLDGNSVVVPPGRPLPRVCVLCGGRRKLRARVLTFQEGGGRIVVAPVWLIIIVSLLGVIHRELNKDVPPPPPLEYWSCEPCELRGMDARHIKSGLMLGGGVGVLGAATAGFNGAPVVALVIILLTAGCLWLAYRKFVRGKRFSVRLGEDGVVLRGIHRDAAQELLKVRLPDVEGVA